MSEPTLKLHLPPADEEILVNEGFALERIEAKGTRWLWIDDAARLLEISEGHLSRKCKDELFARQLARLSFAFEIVEPPALREALEAHARRVLEALEPSTRA